MEKIMYKLCIENFCLLRSLLFLKTYHEAENSTYSFHIKTVRPSSEAPACKGQDSLLAQPLSVLICRPYVEVPPFH